MRGETELPVEGQNTAADGPSPTADSRQPELLSRGQPVIAENGHPSRVSAQRPELSSGGQPRCAQGHGLPADAGQPELPGEGQVEVAEEGQTWRADSRQPELLSEAFAGEPNNGRRAPASAQQPHSPEGHLGNASEARSLLPSGESQLDGGQNFGALPAIIVMPPSNPLTDTITRIRYLHRQRNYAMDKRKSDDSKLGAFLRWQLGWDPEDLDHQENERIKKQAAALIAVGEAEADFLALAGLDDKKSERKRKRLIPKMQTDDPAYVEWRSIIQASIQARAPFDAVEKGVLQEMERAAETLPVWEAFGKGVRGFGSRSLAVIVGEAGDLSNYTGKNGHSKFWKRMGLAVMGEVRQGNPDTAGLSKQAAKDLWIAHGYNKERRSRSYVIADVLMKMGDTYREIYLLRKEYERLRAESMGLTVAPTAKIPKKRVAEFISDGHIHKRAQRYMEKRFLRDLWRAWRDAR